jgi:hypothetical protein
MLKKLEGLKNLNPNKIAFLLKILCQTGIKGFVRSYNPWYCGLNL